MNPDTRVDRGELWNIDELDVESEVYVFHGKAAPFGSSAVAKAKKQFAEDYDVDFTKLVGKKIADVPTRDGGVIVAVYNWPEKASHEVLP